MLLRTAVALAAACLLAAAPSAAPSAASACRAQALGADSFCQVDGARLHFVDWGGAGPALILIPGFGDSARIFDELAPRLAHGHHVYALTRRGFGQSQATSDDVRAERFGDDVIALMDGLGVAQADLVGHSAGGAEMVLVARSRPARVRRLVYLDAAYDRTDALQLEAAEPTPRRPPADALRSYSAFAAWRAATIGAASPAIEANARQTLSLEADSLKPVTPPQRALAIANGGLLSVPPAYGVITAPSLAIYAPKTHPEQIPPEATPAQREASRAYALAHIRPWMLREQARFLETAPCGVALEPGWATHYLFLQRPDWTAATIRAFLETPTPCQFSSPDREASRER